ncbi:hypothetical protein C6503_04290 [Candidatus Poribacteria bacterium]|nr:MAG: hypothetical protein C6503_04290 [Candidatus Poribacteria bacterium]
MIFVDADILSIFAKIQRLTLLFIVFDQETLNIAFAVENEIKTGVSKGFHVFDDIIALQTQRKIRTYYTTPADQEFMSSLPQTLGAGERESIVLCKRLSATFASNDRRVMHHCQTNGIHCINLVDILRLLWELQILSQTDVQKVITEIEIADRLKFRSIDPIFK